MAERIPVLSQGLDTYVVHSYIRTHLSALANNNYKNHQQQLDSKTTIATHLNHLSFRLVR